MVKGLQQLPGHHSSWAFTGRSFLGLVLPCPPSQVTPTFPWELCLAPCGGGRQVCWSWLGKAALAAGLLPQVTMTALPEDRVQDSLAGSGKGAEAASLSVCLT